MKNRKIRIEKIGDATVVTTYPEDKPLRFETYNYTGNYKVYSLNNVIFVEGIGPDLEFLIEELEDDFGAQNAQELLEIFADRYFFVEGSDGGSGPGQQNLEEVTTIGASTTKSMTIIGLEKQMSVSNEEKSISIGIQADQNPVLKIKNGVVDYVLFASEITQLVERSVANKSGYETVSVNDQLADSEGNINIDIATNLSFQANNVQGRLFSSTGNYIDIFTGNGTEVGFSLNNYTNSEKAALQASYAHSQQTGNPHGTSASDIGLGNVNNTSDTDKPISAAQLAALNLKENLINKVSSLAGFTDAEKLLKYPNIKAILDAGFTTFFDLLDYTYSDIEINELVSLYLEKTLVVNDIDFPNDTEVLSTNGFINAFEAIFVTKKVVKKLIAENNLDGSIKTTGVTGLILVKTFPIPANSIPKNGFMWIDIKSKKTVATAVSTTNLNFHPTATSTQTLINGANTGATNTYTAQSRFVIIKDGVFRVFPNSGAVSTDILNSTPAYGSATDYGLNVEVDQNIYLRYSMLNTTDDMELMGLSITTLEI